MTSKIFKPLLAILILAGLLMSCSRTPKPPKSFRAIQKASWSAIEIREGLPFEKAWDAVVEILIKNFDLVQAIRQEGYILTDWNKGWTGQQSRTYKVRVTIKFNSQRTVVRYRPEAQFLGEEGRWTTGADSRLIRDLKADIMGTVGRSVR